MDSEIRAYQAYEADYNDIIGGLEVAFGACVRRYEFLYDLEDSDNHFHGKYFLDDGEANEATFKKVDGEEEAVRFYIQTAAVTSEYVARAWFYTYCQQKSFSNSVRFTNSDIAKGFWAVCYEPFDKGLDEWLKKADSKKGGELKKQPDMKNRAPSKGKGGLKGGKFDSEKVTAFSKLPVIISTNALQPWWCSSIRSLLDGISHIHEKDRFHGSLMKLDNYVMRGNQIKIINVGGVFEAEDEQAREDLKMKDLLDFQEMLRTLLVRGPTPPCDDALRFLRYFEIVTARFSCLECIRRLRGHPFLKLPKDRLDEISEIIREIHGGISYPALNDAVRLGDFDAYKGWDRLIKEDFLWEHWNQEDTVYIGSDIFDLLRFIRNLYIHYKQLTCQNVTMEKADEAVRRDFGRIFDLVYEIQNL